MNNDQTNTTDRATDFAEFLRRTRRSLVPHVVEYHTTDNRIVDAIRLLDNAADHIDSQKGRIEQLECQLAAAREDSARLDWLLNGGAVLIPNGSGHFTSKLHYKFDRSAIDAARSS